MFLFKKPGSEPSFYYYDCLADLYAADTGR